MDPITIGLTLASQYAPSIIKYFTNSDTAGAVAGQVIEIAKTVTGKGTPEESVSAIQADPALALQFRLAVMANEADMDKAFLSDTQDARKRDIVLIDKGVTNYRANIIAAIAGLVVLACLLVVVWATGLDDFAKASITLICGRALGWVEQIFSFEFGTTRSNQTKDTTIQNLSR